MNDDLIKRSEAIWWVKTECNPYGKPTLDFESGKKVIEHLEHMPSADRPQEWIPCSERKPTTEGHYLCSLKKPHRIDNIYVGLAYWTGGRWYGYLANEITAWMPLPKPWEGAE